MDPVPTRDVRGQRWPNVASRWVAPCVLEGFAMNLRLDQGFAFAGCTFLTIFAAGCGVETEVTAEEDAAAISASAPTATASIERVTRHDAGCDIEIESPKIETGNARTDDRIRAALPGVTLEDWCSAPAPSSTFVRQTARIETNRRGIVAVVIERTMTRVTGPGQLPHPSTLERTLNFDLRTGTALRLGTALTAEGRQKIGDACVARMLQEDWDDAEARCAEILADGDAEPTRFIASSAGLRLPYIELASPDADDLLVPWTTLRGTIASPALEAFAAR
jgi:hypothetical protein